MPVLHDVLGPGLAIVFCGTAVGAASARRRAYYAGPGNRFWPTLYEIGLTPRRFDPGEYRELRALRLGLTDLAKSVSGADADLENRDFDCRRLRRTILKHAPRVLAFTSKRAAKEYLGRHVDYGLLPETIGPTRLFVLPSPSGAARGHWDIQHWKELAALSGRTAPSV